MHPEQCPETLERFKARLARRLFDPNVPAFAVECDRELVHLVENGYLLMWERDGTLVFRTTEKFSELAF